MMRKNFIGKRFMKTDNRALSSLITVAGVMAIILMVIGMIMNTLVPQWAKEDESEHMEEVLRNFINMRTNVQNLVENSDLEITATQLVKLGAAGNVPIGVIPSSGTLSLNPLENVTEETIYRTSDELSLYAKGGGNIEYDAANYYFSDQTIVYEHGAVLLGQAAGAAMKAGPEFTVRKYPLLNDSRTFGYMDPGTKDQPGEREYTFGGRHGDLMLYYDIFDVDTDGEVLIKLNGYVIARAPVTAGDSWRYGNSVLLKGVMVNDFTPNRLEFNHTDITGSDAEWGVRNVTVVGDNTHVTVTMVSLMGSPDDIGGRDSHTVHMKLLGSELNTYNWPMENLTLNFMTKYPEAWSDYLNSELNESSTLLHWDANRANTDYYVSTTQTDEDEDHYIVSVTIKGVNRLDATLANVRVNIS
jgi:hypothetical protein